MNDTRSYGYRYDEVSGSLVDIAKAMRRDIKQAQAEGLLPIGPTYSVTTRHGLSIEIEVRDWHDAWIANPDYREESRYEIRFAETCLSDDAKAAKITLERIHNAYNHDGSDVQTDYFDVRYYGIVGFETEQRAAWRKAETDKAKATRAAKDAGTPEKLFTVWRNGQQGVTHLVVRTTDGKQALACGATLWRSTVGSIYDLGSREVTCSRCAKRA